MFTVVFGNVFILVVFGDKCNQPERSVSENKSRVCNPRNHHSGFSFSEEKKSDLGTIHGMPLLGKLGAVKYLLTG